MSPYLPDITTSRKDRCRLLNRKRKVRFYQSLDVRPLSGKRDNTFKQTGEKGIYQRGLRNGKTPWNCEQIFIVKTVMATTRGGDFIEELWKRLLTALGDRMWGDTIHDTWYLPQWP